MSTPRSELFAQITPIRLRPLHVLAAPLVGLRAFCSGTSRTLTPPSKAPTRSTQVLTALDARTTYLGAKRSYRILLCAVPYLPSFLSDVARTQPKPKGNVTLQLTHARHLLGCVSFPPSNKLGPLHRKLNAKQARGRWRRSALPMHLGACHIWGKASYVRRERAGLGAGPVVFQARGVCNSFSSFGLRLFIYLVCVLYSTTVGSSEIKARHLDSTGKAERGGPCYGTRDIAGRKVAADMPGVLDQVHPTSTEGTSRYVWPRNSRRSRVCARVLSRLTDSESLTDDFPRFESLRVYCVSAKIPRKRERDWAEQATLARC